MGKPVSHTARIVAWALLCGAGFGIPAVLFFSSGETSKKQVAVQDDKTIVEAAPAQERGPDGLPGQPKEPLFVREAARDPMSALASPAKPAPPPDPDTLPRRWRLVHQPIATAAGILDIDGLTIVLPGLDTVPTNETCTDPNGLLWPCGMGARTAFRAYLRGRALNCKLPDQRPNDAILGECLLQGEDPAAWLVKNGWARSKLDGPYASLQTEARTTKRGIFGSRPR
jgi:endonuclease YncB( thermonuclease family)